MGAQSKLMLPGPPWVSELAANLGIYMGVFVTGAAAVAVIRKVPALANSRVGRFICFDGPLKPAASGEAEAGGKPSDSTPPGLAALAFATAGIYATLISQGVFQEQLMTRPYATGSFTSSGFAILGTRVLAFLVAQAAMMVQSVAAGTGLFGVEPHRAAFFKFSYSSLANVVSSWCQYESLKYAQHPAAIVFPARAAWLLANRRLRAALFDCAGTRPSP